MHPGTPQNQHAKQWTWNAQHQHTRQQWRTVARSSQPDPSYSPLLNSEVVLNELKQWHTSTDELLKMLGRIADFDPAGKRIILDKLDEASEGVRVTNARLRLCSRDDMGAESILRGQNEQLRHASTSLESMLSGMSQVTTLMRQYIEAEENTSDPQELARIKDMWQQMSHTVLSKIPSLNPNDLTDPLAREGIMHPQALRAATEVSKDPTRLEEWRSEPALYQFLKWMLKSARR
ncbi:hypothetical protein D9Q98_000251 [Chlorella vulgaris]|uniref:Uncharacterized protein n=1 Tax=Chlorella vulgaris TaxID=3077 RepID=A0A9D4TYR4_CHLVU|nr:hypothetical protein D9Q98_000251 [Chlorella vulgaris]